MTHTPQEVDGASVLWRVSSRSSSGGGNCVEAGPFTDRTSRVAIRDTKDRDGGTIIVTTAPWTAFLRTVQTGVLDGR